MLFRSLDLTAADPVRGRAGLWTTRGPFRIFLILVLCLSVLRTFFRLDPSYPSLAAEPRPCRATAMERTVPDT